MHTTSAPSKRRLCLLRPAASILVVVRGRLHFKARRRKVGDPPPARRVGIPSGLSGTKPRRARLESRRWRLEYASAVFPESTEALGRPARGSEHLVPFVAVREPHVGWDRLLRALLEEEVLGPSVQ